MTNGEDGDFLHYHFSADEFYILPILVVAFLEHLVLLFLAIWSAVVLRMRQLLHATYKLFLLAVLLHTVGVFLLGAHYLIYALDGVGHLRSKWNGAMLESASQVAFLLLLILVAKGYTVTRARLRQASVIKVTIFVSLYCIVHFILFVVEIKYFDPGQVGIPFLSKTAIDFFLLFFHAVSQMTDAAKIDLFSRNIVSSKNIFPSPGPVPLRVPCGIRPDDLRPCRLVHVHLLHLLHPQALP